MNYCTFSLAFSPRLPKARMNVSLQDKFRIEIKSSSRQHNSNKWAHMSRDNRPSSIHVSFCPIRFHIHNCGDRILVLRTGHTCAGFSYWMMRMMKRTWRGVRAVCTGWGFGMSLLRIAKLEYEITLPWMMNWFWFIWLNYWYLYLLICLWLAPSKLINLIILPDLSKHLFLFLNSFVYKYCKIFFHSMSQNKSESKAKV